jgi:hypothetical protein
MKRADRRAFKLAYGAWLFGIFAFFVPAATWNPVSRFNLTRAVVERGSLTVDPYITSTGDRAHVGDHWYSDKPPVIAFAAVPAYAAVRMSQSFRGANPDYQAFSTARTPAARLIPNHAYQQALYVCSLLTSGLSGVALALMLFEFLRRRTTYQSAFLASSLVVLGTPLLPYATSFYGHVPAAALIFAAVFCLDPRGSRRLGELPSSRNLSFAGACVALAAGSEYLAAIPGLLVLLSFLLWAPAAARLRAGVFITCGGILPALLVGLYHTAVFGAPWRTGYAFEDQAAFVAGHASGLMGIHLPSIAGLVGLTLGVRRGLFYIAPVTALAFVYTVGHVVRRRDWAVGAGLGVLLTLLSLNAGYYMWWGGAAAGPRHLVPGMAFLAIGLAALFRSRRRWLRALAGALALISVANCFAITLVGIEAPEFGDILQNFVWSRLRNAHLAHTAGATNLGEKLGLSPVGSVIPLLIWTLAGFAYFAHKAGQRPARRPRVQALGLTTDHVAAEEPHAA